MDVEIIDNNLLIAIESAERQYKIHGRKGKEEKISPEKKKLLRKRRELKNKNNINLNILRQLNKDKTIPTKLQPTSKKIKV